MKQEIKEILDGLPMDERLVLARELQELVVAILPHFEIFRRDDGQHQQFSVSPFRWN